MISLRMRDRLAAPLVLVYWAALVVGLSVYSTARADADELWALWLGALGGTALGQSLALKNVRAWLAAVVVAGVALLAAPALAGGGAPTALAAALVPAALCGYWSLGERSAPAAFWFPAMTWMLTVVDRLDGDDAAATLDARAFVLLGGVAVLFLALLWAAERRRVGLWRTVGRVSGRAATLREPAGRTVARAGFAAAVAALTLALTAWVAPHLWQGETLRGQRVTEFADGIGVGERDGEPCCPLVSVEAPRVRVREFLDVAHGVTRPPARAGLNCVACDVAARISGRVGAAVPVLATTAPVAPAPAPVAPATHEVAPVTPVAPRVPTTPTTPLAAPSPPAPTATPTATPTRTTAPVVAAVRTPSPKPRADLSGLMRLLLLMVVAAAALVAATSTLRPLRRAVTLRHLRRPYWVEPLEQRVSNLWQLALVGLRDAGFCARAGEQPEELARRVRVDGVGECAAVLERARHGLGVADGDVAAMRRAAELAYRAARARLSLLARIASALRWPLT